MRVRCLPVKTAFQCCSRLGCRQCATPVTCVLLQCYMSLTLVVPAHLNSHPGGARHIATPSDPVLSVFKPNGHGVHEVSFRSVSEYVSSGQATPSPLDDTYMPRCAYEQAPESALPSSFVVMPLGHLVQNGWSLKSEANVPCRKWAARAHFRQRHAVCAGSTACAVDMHAGWCVCGPRQQQSCNKPQRLACKALANDE